MRTPTVICFLILAVAPSSFASLSGSANARSSISQANGPIFQAVQIHDIAVTTLAVSQNEFYAFTGGRVAIDVTVQNEGDFVEKFNVTVYANCTSEPVVVDVYYVLSLGSGDAISIPFGWKIPDIPGNYSVIAEASVVEGEIDTTNNVQTQYVYVKTDDTTPVIGIPIVIWDESIQVQIWDSGTGVRDAILSWSIDNGTTWSNQTMGQAGPSSPGLEYFYAYVDPGSNPEGKLIKYEIYAYDNVGNGALRDNAGAYYDFVYHVIPEFSLILTPLFFGLATSMTALLYRKVIRKRD